MNRHRRPSSRPERYRRTAWAIALVASVLTGLVSLTSTVAGASSPPGFAYLSDQVAVSYAVIRLDSSPLTGYGGPTIHVNATHSSAGVTKVERTTSGDLRIYNNPGGAIGACIAGEDETLTRMGIMAGSSGGAGTTIVTFWCNGKHVRIQDINNSLANVWVLWVADPQ